MPEVWLYPVQLINEGIKFVQGRKEVLAQREEYYEGVTPY
jgi:hypothetical protein